MGTSGFNLTPGGNAVAALPAGGASARTRIALACLQMRFLWSGKLAVILAAVAVVAGGAVWWSFARHAMESCEACLRGVHAESRTVGLIEGKRAVFCCPTCALTEHKQSGKHVRISHLTDYLTRASLEPGKAVLVRGSDLNPCRDSQAHLSHDKQPLHVHFDRCSPSILAFATRDAAMSYLRRHGGQITDLRAVEASLR
jgi:hypothetical protein